MGKRQSKMVSPTKASNGNGEMPDKYLLVVKEAWCGACKGLQAMFDQLKSSNQLNVNPYVLTLAEAKANPTFARLLQQGYAFHGEKPGPIPFMMIVRNGRVVKADTKLGGFRDIGGLKAFLQRV